MCNMGCGSCNSRDDNDVWIFVCWKVEKSSTIGEIFENE